MHACMESVRQHMKLILTERSKEMCLVVSCRHASPETEIHRLNTCILVQLRLVPSILVLESDSYVCLLHTIFPSWMKVVLHM